MNEILKLLRNILRIFINIFSKMKRLINFNSTIITVEWLNLIQFSAQTSLSSRINTCIRQKYDG